MVYRNVVSKRKGVRRIEGEQRERLMISLLDFDWEFGGKGRGGILGWSLKGKGESAELPCTRDSKRKVRDSLMFPFHPFPS